MTEQITRNIYKIDIPFINNPLGNLNSYFVSGSERNLLIDTGYNSSDCYKFLLEGLNELNADMDKTDIFLTHHHGDHSGLSAVISRPGTRILISAQDADILLRHQTYEEFNESRLFFIAQGLTDDDFNKMGRRPGPSRIYEPNTAPDYARLNNGDKLNYGGYEFECILSPGHTAGHMCLYEKENKLMILGDHVLFDISPNITASKSFESSLSTYLESLKKFKNYDVDIPLPAHRGVSSTMHERIDELLAHHADRLSETQDIVDSNCGLTAYDVAGYLTWNIRANSWDEFPIAQKWFALGETISHLNYLLERDLIKRSLKSGLFIYEKAN